MEALVQGQVDVAHLGGFTFVQANKRAGAVPLVQRDRDREFHSKFITARDDLRSLGDLKAKRFAFGDVNSTSGHLMPAYFMRKEGVESCGYRPGHLHRRPRCDRAGGGRAPGGRRGARRGGLGTTHEGGEGRSVQGPRLLDHAAVLDYLWVARRDLDPAVARKVAEAFLALDPNKPEDRPILELLSAKGRYVAVDAAAYGPLREAAVREGLLR